MDSHLLRIALSFLGIEIALLQVGEGDFGKWTFPVDEEEQLDCSFCSTDVGSIDLGLDIVD